jgi:preprotein translocase subunit YajC
MNLNFILLQADAQQGSSVYGNILMIVLMIAVFYFFLIRPQTKKQKEIKKFQESVTKGTKVVTSGGIYGVVDEVKDRYFIVEIANGVRVRIDKNCVFAAPDGEPNAAK